MIRHFPENEFVKYVIAGGFSFLCDLCALYVCTEYVGLHYLVSGLIGYGVGLVVSYYLNVTWVFRFRKYDKRVVEFGLFNLIVVAGLILNELIIYVAVDNIEVHYLYGKVASGLIIFLFNYFAKKYLLFNDGDRASLVVKYEVIDK